MTLSIQSRTLSSLAPLGEMVELYLAGDENDFANITNVVYDLGSGFDDPVRKPAQSAPPFSLKVKAYGGFSASARVERGDDAPLLLRIEVRVAHTAEDAERTLAHESVRAIPLGRRIAAAPWMVYAVGFGLAALAVLLVRALYEVSSSESALLPTALRPAAAGGNRWVVLAALAGALAAALRSLGSISAQSTNRSLRAAWLYWCLLQPFVGAALSLASYFSIVMAFNPQPGLAGTFGAIAWGAFVGLYADRATTILTDLSRALFGPETPEPPTAKDEPASLAQNRQPTARDKQRAQLERAARILRGADAAAAEVFKLAKQLKGANQFGTARKLFARLRAGNDYRGIDRPPVYIAQQEALCTYKDPDLPAGDRFRVALELLDGVDRLEQDLASQQETLCLRGAVYKRRWQVEAQHADLELALSFYIRAYELGFEDAASDPRLPDSGAGFELDGDTGYAALNAAFMLELSARESAKDAHQAKRVSEEAKLALSKAREIRRRITRRLPQLAYDRTNEKGKHVAGKRGEWWFHTTLAEAHFALGEYEQALAALQDFNLAKNPKANELAVELRGAPRLSLEESPHPWEMESFVTQCGAIAQLQEELAELLGSRPKAEASAERARAEGALRSYLGALAPGLDRIREGKIGLGLSGGGFRASLFHIGVLAQLAERELLRRVEVLSCVSGGSILGAHYYLELRNLLQKVADGEIKSSHYLAIIKRLERDFLEGVQTNIRCQVFSSIWGNLRAFFQPTYTTTRRLGELYESQLYSQVDDAEDGPRYLNRLFIQPHQDLPDFQPKYENWRRKNKVPMLVLNATTLNTGHLWQFTASFMGEPPSRTESEIESNYRLRRMYYWEAPRLRDRWRRPLFRPFAPPDYQNFRLGDAVAASSCVPGLFEPIMLPDLFAKKAVALVDGGVYDNQGIATLLEQDCTLVILSDASGQTSALDNPSTDRLGVPLRSFGVSMARVRQAQYQEVDGRKRSGLLKDFALLHLTKDLDPDLIDWRECQDPHDAGDLARPADRRGVLTGYGVQKTVQRLLSGIRTDLDSFTEVEAYALMLSGYRMAERELEKLGIGSEKRVKGSWKFLEIEELLGPGAGYDDLKEQLHVGRLTAGKIWLLSWVLTGLGALLVVALLAGIVMLVLQNRGKVLVTVGGLGTFALVTALTLVFPYLVRIVRYKQSLRDIGIKGLLAIVLAVAFKIHLAYFDPVFLRRGSLARLAKQRRGARQPA